MSGPPIWERSIVALFCDGGMIERNPSTLGGTWAWCASDMEGVHVREQSGYVLPAGHPHPGWARVEKEAVSNNDCEFYAALRALENVPAGWIGKLATDSEVTIKRLRRLLDGEVIDGLPESWSHRAGNALARVQVRFVHLAGHPTRIDLERGHALKEGVKVQVSRHNVWCDARCGELARTWRDRLGAPRPGLPVEAAG